MIIVLCIALIVVAAIGGVLFTNYLKLASRLANAKAANIRLAERVIQRNNEALVYQDEFKRLGAEIRNVEWARGEVLTRVEALTGADMNEVRDSYIHLSAAEAHKNGYAPRDSV